MKLRKVVSIFLACVLLVGMVAGCGTETAEKAETDSESKPYEGVELSMMVDNNTSAEGYTAAFDLAEEELGIKVNVEVGMNGTEQENIIKTRLAAGEAPDIVYYNTGSLLAALNPEQYFIDLSDTEMASTFDDGFTQAASVDGKL